METTISVVRQNNRITLINDKGHKWTMKGIDDESAIAALIFFSVKHFYESIRMVSDDFSIRLTMDAVINDKT